MMGDSPDEVRIIGNRYCSFRAKAGVVLDNHDTWNYGVYCFPNPIVVGVDVDREHSYFAGYAIAANQIVDVLSRNEGLFSFEIVAPINLKAEQSFITRENI